jgi:peptidoglycan/xylan/chitin deacetylase (PgdA/CDA1 family)
MTTDLERAVMLISIDTEMAWGVVHHGSPSLYHWPEERQVLSALLDVLDAHEIPATWAMVGHLFLTGCSRVDGRAHPEILRPRFEGRHDDWFVDDPCQTASPGSQWYAPDLVHEILDRRTPHELASHGFSHVMIGEPGCDVDVFQSELAAAQAAADHFGVRLESFVYPRNSIGHQDVLRANGYVAYRGARPNPFRAGNGARQRALRLFDSLVPGPPSVVKPIDEAGLWNFPATALYGFDLRSGRARLWQWQLRRRLRHAIRHRGLFHLWLHPHNLRRAPEAALEGLDRICHLAGDLREQGRLDTLTFSELAGRLRTRAPEPLAPAPERHPTAAPPGAP